MKKKTFKRYLSILFVSCIVLGNLMVYAVEAKDFNSIEGIDVFGYESSETELLPLIVAPCSSSQYFHYSDIETWGNGNCKSVTVTQYYNGKIVSQETFTYPETGNDAFVFNGCKCPMCNCG